MMQSQGTDADMFYSGTVKDELSADLKADPNGEALRRYRRRLAIAHEKAEGVSCESQKDMTIRALQAGTALLPVLWRDLNRR